MKIHSKLCQRCGEKRPLTDFYPDNSHKLGVGTYCKSCSAALAGEAYQRRKRAAKITPESKVCGTCQEILDGSLLDAENLALIADMAAAEDFQVWVERVDDASDVGVVIEDGSVAE